MTMEELQIFLSLAQKHPQTGEPMLTYDQLTAMLSRIAQTGCALLLGGDVLSSQGQHLYLNWHYEKNAVLSPAENARQSCNAAYRYIDLLPERAQYLYIPVFVSPF